MTSVNRMMAPTISYDCLRQKGLLDKKYVDDMARIRFAMAGGYDSMVSQADPAVLKGVSPRMSKAMKRMKAPVKTVADVVYGAEVVAGGKVTARDAGKMAALRAAMSQCPSGYIPPNV